MVYQQVTNGEPIMVEKKEWIISCCDCGLVHVLKFKDIKKLPKHLLITIFRDGLRTGARRRAKRGKLKTVPK